MKRKLIPFETERVYHKNQAFLAVPVQATDEKGKPIKNLEGLVLSGAPYHRDPATGTLRRINPPRNKHQRRAANAKHSN